jgi:hypothetical protein
MSAASWGRPRPTSTPWRERGEARSASPCEHEDEKIKLPPFKDRASGGVVAYLRVESPAYSSLGDRRALCLRPTSPPPHPQTPPRHAPAPPRRALPLSWTAWRRALPHLPLTLAPPPPPRLLARGAQAPTSRGEIILCRSPPPLPRPTMSTPNSSGERVPAARTAGTPHPSIHGAPVVGSSSPSCAPPAPTPAAAPHARARARGVGGSDRAASTVTICRGRAKD